jgi:rod shape-determining protein MreC
LNLSAFISAHRPVLMLTTLVLLCLASLATGFESSLVHNVVIRIVSLTAYPFLESRALIETGVDRMISAVFTQEELRQENEALRQEVALMRRALSARNEMAAENRRLRADIGFLSSEPRLQLEPAKVIESLKGAITIGRGSRQGVEPFMGVITPQGVVGMVTNVGDFSSRVATLHHPDCKIGAMVERNRLRAYDGVLHADGTFRLICSMWYIDMKDDVRVGDRIVTSPESIFPSGFPIGTVRAVHSGEALLKNAEIDPFVDPYRLDEVFIIKAAGPRLEDFQGPIRPDLQPRAAAGNLEAADETMPLQEKFAP